MAALTHGPRLGAPSSTGFKVWVRADGAATTTLEVKLTTASDWTVADTSSIDVSKYNTDVLEATGLEPATKYDYRVKFDGVVVATYSTITMPPDGGGRFIAYQTTDLHGDVYGAPNYAAIYEDYSTNYEPSGIPAIVVQYGDWHQMGSGPNPPNFLYTAQTAADGALDQWTEMATLYGADSTAFVTCLATIPMLYMWDDWDFGGNNSNMKSNVFAGDASVALDYWDILWRDNPQPVAGARCYSYTVAGVPFIVADVRSNKTPQIDVSGTYVTYTTPYDWRLPVRESVNTVFGSAQRAWLLGEFYTHRNKALVVFVHSHTFRDAVVPYRSPYNTGGVRDATGIFYRAERNLLLRALASYGYAWRNNLVVWTGDDHWDVVWRGHAGDETVPPGTSAHDITNQNYPPAGNLFNFLEVKVSANPVYSTNAGNSPIVFGADEADTYFAYHTKAQPAPGSSGNITFARWDISSTYSGEHVAARATIIVAAQGADNTDGPYVRGDIEIDDYGRVGDFYFEDGYFNYYDATSAAQAQRYPPENSPADTSTFSLTFIDDINGLPVDEANATRDSENRLRDKRDEGDTDRDDLIVEWRIREEARVDEP